MDYLYSTLGGLLLIGGLAFLARYALHHYTAHRFLKKRKPKSRQLSLSYRLENLCNEVSNLCVEVREIKTHMQNSEQKNHEKDASNLIKSRIHKAPVPAPTTPANNNKIA
jgi:hypothetical protein